MRKPPTRHWCRWRGRRRAWSCVCRPCPCFSHRPACGGCLAPGRRMSRRSTGRGSWRIVSYRKDSKKDAKPRMRRAARALLRIFGAGRLFAGEGIAARDAVSAAPVRKMYGSNTIAGG